jgi:hypothetical protein
MAWFEFFIRVFGWLLALIVFLIGKEVWERWREKRRK